MHYEDPPEPTRACAQAALERDEPAELAALVIGVGLHGDGEWAEAVCTTLARHRDSAVRGNALLALGHLARRFGKLDRSACEPLLREGLGHPDRRVSGQAEAAWDDAQHFLGWGEEAAERR